MNDDRFMERIVARAAVLAALWIVAGCPGTSRPDAKSTVHAFFAALHSDDTTAVQACLDLSAAARSVRDEYPDLFGPSDSLNPDPGATLLIALSGDGIVRRRWMEDQIVLGKETVREDTALVEVSFIDRVTRVQYYNKMRLEYRTDRWVITHFRTP